MLPPARRLVAHAYLPAPQRQQEKCHAENQRQLLEKDLRAQGRIVEKVGRRYAIEFLWVYGILG